MKKFHLRMSRPIVMGLAVFVLAMLCMNLNAFAAVDDAMKSQIQELARNGNIEAIADLASTHPDLAADIAAIAAGANESLAGDIAAAVAKAVPDKAAEIAGKVAGVVPGKAAEIAGKVAKEVPGAAEAIVNSVVAASGVDRSQVQDAVNDALADEGKEDAGEPAGDDEPPYGQ